MTREELKRLQPKRPLLDDVFTKMESEGLTTAEADPHMLKYYDDYGRVKTRKRGLFKCCCTEAWVIQKKMVPIPPHT